VGVTRVLLVRHGRTTANASGVLAGRLPNIHLDDAGVAQAVTVGKALRSVPVTHLVASPLSRTVETAKLIAGELDGRVRLAKDKGVIECDYGDWSGKKLKRLANEPLWSVVQSHPSSVTFPNGESMSAAQQRAVSAIRGWVDVAREESGPNAIVLVVSHADVIKSIIADALGLHLDLFQRIVVDPGSVSAIDYTPTRPFLRFSNLTDQLAMSASMGIPATSDAPVGGGAGSAKKRK